jgi:hypothetical protein
MPVILRVLPGNACDQGKGERFRQRKPQIAFGTGIGCYRLHQFRWAPDRGKHSNVLFECGEVHYGAVKFVRGYAIADALRGLWYCLAHGGPEFAQDGLHGSGAPSDVIANSCDLRLSGDGRHGSDFPRAVWRQGVDSASALTEARPASNCPPTILSILTKVVMRLCT